MLFTSIIARFPFIILCVFTAITSICLIIPIYLKKVPSFSDPQLGFEARGTILAKRLMTWQNLLESTKHAGPFVSNPNTFLHHENKTEIKLTKKFKNKKKNSMKFITDKHCKVKNKSVNKTKTGRVKKKFTNDSIAQKHSFCGTPDQRYSHVVLSANGIENLFLYKALQSMCRIENQFVETKDFHLICDTITNDQCCKPWSISNYVMLLNNRSSCNLITEQDVISVLTLLQTCSQYYYNKSLTHDCDENNYCQAPPECIKHNAVYIILHYLTDVNFLPQNDSTRIFLTDSILFLPIASSTKIINFYHEIQQKTLYSDDVRVVAMNFGLKNVLFDEYLVRDIWLLGAGGFCILICMWVYTESAFLTVMTIIAIVYALLISYFIYTWIFGFTFFPFMNLLAVIVAVGIGVDDAFIFSKIWQSSTVRRMKTKTEMLTETFHHAFMSMLVTSLTTTAAFYTSFFSSITAVCCFSIFAGTTVIINFVLMVTWFPACLVISEKWHRCDWDILGNKWRLYIKAKCAICKNILLIVTLKFRYVWLSLFFGLSIISLLIVLHNAGLQLPDQVEFQLFDDSHPFEEYDLVYKHKFRFERMQKENSADFKLPLRFVWGIHPTDTGDYMNPYSKGDLEIDPTFNMSDPESQKWLLKFCQDLKAQPFYLPFGGIFLSNCFIESFINFMQRPCSEFLNDTSCCGIQHFPYGSNLFDLCIIQAMSALYDTPSSYFMAGVSGPKFSRLHFPKIQVVVVEFDSVFDYSLSYIYMEKFYKQVETWMGNKSIDAPLGMRNGWFISDLDFYELQRILSKSTILAISIAMIISFLVLFIVTLNILISFYAILIITSCIFTILAILILLDWKLNVLESIAVSSTVGLAVDFCLHFCISYRLYSLDNNRLTATKLAVSNMAEPTAMAALTTGIVGALMLISSVLPYTQIGIFLVVVMIVSWLYSTFLLGAFLSIAGPEHGFGQFHYPLFLCKNHTNSSTDDVQSNEGELQIMNEANTARVDDI